MCELTPRLSAELGRCEFFKAALKAKLVFGTEDEAVKAALSGATQGTGGVLAQFVQGRGLI